MHEIAPAGDQLPGGHGLHEGAPGRTPDDVPAGHDTHGELSVELFTMPAVDLPLLPLMPLLPVLPLLPAVVLPLLPLLSVVFPRSLLLLRSAVVLLLRLTRDWLLEPPELPELPAPTPRAIMPGLHRHLVSTNIKSTCSTHV